MKYIRFYNPYLNAYRDGYDCAMLPAANIYEAGNEFKIEMALPGVDRKDIQINYEMGFLTVSVKKEQDDNGENRYDRREFNYHGAKRTFRTGEKVDTDQITAKLENGVLTLTLPKKEAFVQKPAKNIEIA